MVMQNNFKGLFAALGERPTVTFQTDLNYYDSFQVVAPTVFDSSGIYQTCAHKVIVQANGTWICVYVQQTTSQYLPKFVIYTNEGVNVVPPTVIESVNVECVSAAVLPDGKWVCVWGYKHEERVKYAIYKDDGTLITGPTQIYFKSNAAAYAIDSIDVLGLYNGNWVCCFDQSYFVIYDGNGTQVLGVTQMDTTSGMGAVVSIKLLDLNNGNWVCAYGFSDGKQGNFVIYNVDGTVVIPNKTFWSGMVKNIDCAVFSNGTFIIVWGFKSTGTSMFQVYTESGTPVGGVGSISGGTVSQKGIGALQNDNWVICTEAGYSVYTDTGTQLFPFRQFHVPFNHCFDVVVLPNNNWLCVFETKPSGSNNSVAKFIIYRPFTPAGLAIKTDAYINGVTFSQKDTPNVHRIIDVAGAKLTLRWCAFKHAVNLADRKYAAYCIHGTGSLDMQGTLLANADGGVSISGSSIMCERNIFYRITEDAALTIKGAGNGISIRHNTFFNNYGAVRLISNNGQEIIRDSIFFDNENYALKADVQLTIGTSLCPDSLINAELDTRSVRHNPRFIDEGYGLEADMDLHLQHKDLGYAAHSPAIGIASDGTDAGAYLTEYVFVPPVYYTAVIDKPFLDFEMKPVGDVKLILDDGDIFTFKKSQHLQVKMKWKGIQNSDYAEVFKVWMRGGDFLIYYDPVSSPEKYLIMKLIWGDVSMSPELYRLARTGVGDVELIFIMKFEREDA
jgi:hypothetical protein